MAQAPDGNNQRADSHADDTTTPRRPYVSPELIEYGTVAKLTQTGGQSVQDFFTFRRMMCL